MVWCAVEKTARLVIVRAIGRQQVAAGGVEVMVRGVALTQVRVMNAEACAKPLTLVKWDIKSLIPLRLFLWNKVVKCNNVMKSNNQILCRLTFNEQKALGWNY